ncbi:MAG TPA: GNAT family N-acetyltransferase [Solirubrobacteraceae bacterium]|jgi:GNAT superfamily N-acetyltransferase|nr:GNAT family N-acetyltransferase [Solirubrobacteraceae bacterium]
MSNSTARSEEDSSGPPGSWSLRSAKPADLPEVTRAICNLLTELAGSAPAPHEIEAAAAELLADPKKGCLMIADSADGMVGVLAASFQHAIHVPGCYCILQDLWTDPSWRSRGVGAGLVAALLSRLSELNIKRVEVGLPSARFDALQVTETFYRQNGFTLLGPRMRHLSD